MGQMVTEQRKGGEKEQNILSNDSQFFKYDENCKPQIKWTLSTETNKSTWRKSHNPIIQNLWRKENLISSRQKTSLSREIKVPARAGIRHPWIRCCWHLPPNCPSWSSDSTLNDSFLSMYTLQGERWEARYLGPCHPREISCISSWFLTGLGQSQLLWTLGSEPVTRSLSLPFK